LQFARAETYVCDTCSMSLSPFPHAPLSQSGVRLWRGSATIDVFKDLSTLPLVQHVPLHSTASARAAAAAVDAFHISDGHSGLGSRRGGAFANSRESNARRRMSLDNSALDPAAGWPVTGQSMEGYALTYVARFDSMCHKVHV